MSTTSTHREIVEEASFADAFSSLRISYQRLDEVMAGVTAALVMQPQLCPVIEGTVLSMIKTRAFPNVPGLRIFFTYTDTEINLRHVEAIKNGDEENPTGDEASPAVA